MIGFCFNMLAGVKEAGMNWVKACLTIFVFV